MSRSQPPRERIEESVRVLHLAVDAAVRALQPPGADRLPKVVPGTVLSDFVSMVGPVREALREAAGDVPDGRLPIVLSFVRNAFTHAEHGDGQAARDAFLAARVALERLVDGSACPAPPVRN